LGVHLGLQLPTWEFTWECKGSFLHILCTFGSMWCGSQVALLARNLASPCFSREPKARVATITLSILLYFFTIFTTLNMPIGGVQVLFKCQKKWSPPFGSGLTWTFNYYNCNSITINEQLKDSTHMLSLNSMLQTI
jgi:hypothetical protein